jgi:hypothetical protein
LANAMGDAFGAVPLPKASLLGGCRVCVLNRCLLGAV